MRAFWIAVLYLLLAPLAAVAQDDDRDFLTAFLEDNLSSAGRNVTVTGFSGAFSSRAEIETLTIADESGVWLTLNGVVLDWNRSALLRGVVDVTELLAEEIIVARRPLPPANAVPSPEAQGFSLPELPVAIKVEKLQANRIVLAQPVIGQALEGSLDASLTLDGGEGRANLEILRIDAGPEGRVQLDASYSNTSRELSLDLSVVEDAGGIAATLLDLPGAPSVDLTLQGAGPLEDFAATLGLQTDGVQRLAGSLTLQGQEEGAQRFELDVQGDVAPLFLPDYAAFFGPEISLRAEALRQVSGQLDLSALSLKARALSLEGVATIAADGLPQRLDLQGTLGLPGGAPVLLPLGGGAETRVTGADISVGFDASQGDDWRAALTLTGLDRPDIALESASITGAGSIIRGAGSGAIIGGTLEFGASGVDIADPALATALGRDLTGSLTFDWEEGGLGLRIGRLVLTEDGYDITADARFSDFESGFRTSGSVEARYADLSRLSGLAGRSLGGAGAARISGEVQPLGGEFDIVGNLRGTDISLAVPEVDNLLKGSSRIEFSVARSAQGTFLRQLDVTARTLTASVSGNLASDGSDLAGELAFADLSVLGPDYGGTLGVDARFTGTPAEGQITLDGMANDLKTGQPQVDALTTGESQLSVVVALRGDRLTLEKAEVINPQLRADAQGYYDPAGSDITADLSMPDLSPLGPGYRGSLQADVTLQGTLDAGRVELSGQGNNLAIGNAQADSLLRGQSNLRAAATFRDRQVQIETVTLTNPQVTASAKGSATNDVQEVQLEARLANLALLVPEFPGAVTVSGNASQNGNGVTLDLQGRGPGGIDARVTGRIAPGYRSADLSINGTAQAGLANAFLGQRSISGQTQFDLRLNGPFALSSLSGQARLSGGRFSAPTLPIGLQDIAATATLGGSAVQLDVSAGAVTGGTLGVRGSIGLAAPNTADLQVSLVGITLKDPDLYTVDLGGDLTLRGPLTGGAVIGGTVRIREAELRVPTSGFSAVGSLPGLEHRNEPAPVRATRQKAGLIDVGGAEDGTNARPFGLDLRIEAPSRIFLRGRGIDAELGGVVALRGDTNTVIPSGAFELIRGRLDILGKRLVLDEARLLLQGDLIPTLNIVATNQSDDVTTSVVIEGRADDPEISFRSSPELPQEEVLARLLFGRDLQNISALQAAQLANAVATLAGRGGEGIISRLRSGFGLDDFDVSTDDDGNLSLTAGKYISSRVYTEVEVDQKGRSKISLNLDMKKGVTVRGAVGADGQTGIGVFIERDY